MTTATIGLDANALVAAAREQTGLTDLGDDAILEGLDVLVDAINREAKLTEAAQARDAALADLDAEAVRVAAPRADIVAGVGDDLVTLYDKIRAQSGGLGAAPLRYQTPAVWPSPVAPKNSRMAVKRALFAIAALITVASEPAPATPISGRAEIRLVK